MPKKFSDWYVGDDYPANKKTYDYYKSQYVRLKKATEKLLLVSFGSAGILATHPKENLCATLCVKFSTTARSLYLLSPNPQSPDFFSKHLDFTSSATIARVLVSNFAMLYHFGIESCSEDEFRVRQLLMWWRDYRVRRKMNFEECYREGAVNLTRTSLQHPISLPRIRRPEVHAIREGRRCVGP